MKKILLLLIIPILTFSQTIQEQIDAAEEGSIVNIENGIFNESISITKSITLNCNDNCIIDASGSTGGIYIESSDVTINNFEIIGNNETTYGIVITPICSNISITNNEIHGMSLPNQSNTSPLSYGILAYGNSINESPTNLDFSNNYIYNIAGSGISLGSFTGEVNIENNIISDLITVNFLEEDFNVGIQAQASQYTTIKNNDFINLIIGSNLIFTTGEIEGNNYTNTTIFLSHTTLAPILFEDEVDWWSVNGTIEYSGMNFDITSYFNSLENAIIIASQNGSNIISDDGINYVLGCLDTESCNYNQSANINNDSCEYANGCDYCSGEIDGTGVIINGDTDNDGICDYNEIYGCNDLSACNYNPEATESDDSCFFTGDECIVATGLNGEIIYGIWDDLCECIGNNSAIEELYNPQILIKIINILSQESTNKKGFQLKIYDDGSVEKKYLVN